MKMRSASYAASFQWLKKVPPNNWQEACMILNRICSVVIMQVQVVAHAVLLKHLSRVYLVLQELLLLRGQVKHEGSWIIPSHNQRTHDPVCCLRINLHYEFLIAEGTTLIYQRVVI